MMGHVIITGSTRGIGLGLAKEFLKNGYKVTINGTSEESVTKAISELHTQYDKEKIFAYVADTTDFGALESLWDNAVDTFGAVDIWINNAGIDQSRKYIWEMDTTEVDKLINVNIKGIINGSTIAFRNMLTQGHGFIYNMEGLGSDGRMLEKFSLYGTTKRALCYFTRALAKEARNSPVKVGALSPGMVITDFLKNGLPENEEEANRVKKGYNILADSVETVSKFLVDEMIKNTENDAKIYWLTTRKIFVRFLLAPFNKRDFF